jgi:hypothetical protein
MRRCVPVLSNANGTVSAQVFGLEIHVKNMTENATTDDMDVVGPDVQLHACVEHA